jgi:hypothetical protein
MNDDKIQYVLIALAFRAYFFLSSTPVWVGQVIAKQTNKNKTNINT